MTPEQRAQVEMGDAWVARFVALIRSGLGEPGNYALFEDEYGVNHTLDFADVKRIVLSLAAELRQERAAHDALTAEVARLNAMRTHCDQCGGDYLATGLSVCPCRLTAEVEGLRRERDDLREEFSVVLRHLGEGGGSDTMTPEQWRDAVLKGVDTHITVMESWRKKAEAARDAARKEVAALKAECQEWERRADHAKRHKVKAEAEVAALKKWRDNNDHWQARAEIHDHDRLVYKARAEAAEAEVEKLKARAQKWKGVAHAIRNDRTNCERTVYTASYRLAQVEQERDKAVENHRAATENWMNTERLGASWVDKAEQAEAEVARLERDWQACRDAHDRRMAEVAALREALQEARQHIHDGDALHSCGMDEEGYYNDGLGPETCWACLTGTALARIDAALAADQEPTGHGAANAAAPGRVWAVGEETWTLANGSTITFMDGDS